MTDIGQFQNKSVQSLVILAHADDEIFLLPWLMRQSCISNSLLVVYLTDPFAHLRQIRERESREVLESIGILPENIFFLGGALQIPDGQLPLHATRAFQALLESLGPAFTCRQIVTPLWEGGHQDHDACAHIGWALKRRLVTNPEVLAFPLYQGENLPSRFFRTNRAPQQYQSSVQQFAVSASEAWQTARFVATYRSQWKAFVGLAGPLLWNTLIRRKNELVVIDKDAPLRARPHSGLLLYERYRRTTYAEVSRHLDRLTQI